MRRVRVPVSGLALGRLALPKDTSRYLVRVLRVAAGAEVTLFDPSQAREASAVLVEAHPERAVVEVGPLRDAELRPRREVMIVQGIGKADKTDAVVRDATELGATHVVPVATERSVATRSSPAAHARWNRIAIEAARQCGRGDVPRVEPARPLRAALESSLSPFLATAGARGFVLHPDTERELGHALGTLAPSAPVCFVIGPEGGLSSADLALLVAGGLEVVRFGHLVLRTETVCAAVLGATLAL